MKSPVVGMTAALALMVGGAADASLLTLGVGSSFTTLANNNVLGGGNTLSDNAVLSTTAANVKLEYFFWGSESGFTNTLFTPFGSHTELNPSGSGGPVLFPGFASMLFSGVQTASGAVNMSFSALNGSNPRFTGLTPGGANNGRSIAFAFLNTDGTFASSDTNIAVFALDDSGANKDDDHDDYVGYVRASVVPIPAAAWLFGSAILGLVAVGRRKLMGTEA